nr:RNA-directed DNA polymerase, eukaryota [Tanacetum cinerariifolium]
IVMQAASSIGCGVLHKQFRYLGVMVGKCGRLTILKAVLGASPLYNMSIFKVPKGILNSMEAIRRDKPLKDLFPRLFALELNKEVTVAAKVQGVVSNSFRRPMDLRFIWRWGVSSERGSPDMSMVGGRLASFRVFFGLELLVFFDSSSSKVKALLEGVFGVVWWSIWGFKNRTVYNKMPPRRSVLFDDIVSLSFNWFSSRCNRAITWDS